MCDAILVNASGAKGGVRSDPPSPRLRLWRRRRVTRSAAACTTDYLSIWTNNLYSETVDFITGTSDGCNLVRASPHDDRGWEANFRVTGNKSTPAKLYKVNAPV